MSALPGLLLFAAWSLLCYVLGALGVFHKDGDR